MHCISCETILDREIKNLEWVKLLMLSYKKGIMEVEYSDESKYKELVKIIEKNNFSVLETDKKQEVSLDNILWNIIAFLFVIILLISSKLFDIYSIIPDTSSINYFSAIIIWLIASVSTCLAITWWIIVGFSRYLDKWHWFLGHLKVQTSFQVWRLLGFFIFGWILWYFGSFFSINFTINSIITFLVGFLLFYMWLNILGIVPSITKYWIHMPKRFTEKIESFWHPKFAPIVWALTFFLPCWFTQTMQLLAISSWSFWQGWLVMFLFALWTTPVFLALWLWSSYFKWKKFTILTKILWSIVVFFWIFTLINSYNLIKFIDLNPFNSSTNSSWEVQDLLNASWDKKENVSLEEVFVKHNWYQTSPAIVELEAWWNYKITIMPTSNGLWCMSTLVLPWISTEIHQVKAGEPIVYEIYDAKPWKYSMVCASMWMTQWQIIIK